MPSKKSGASPKGYAIFCDDIRQETNNKVSFMGVYTGTLFLYSPFPVTLPKFCIAVTYGQDLKSERRPVTLKVLVDREGEEPMTLLEGPIPVEEAIDKLGQPDPLFSEPGIAASMHVVLSPFTIENECVLKVRADYGDEEVKLGALVVRSAQPGAEPISINF